MGFMVPKDSSVECIDDKFFSHTKSINNFFSTHYYFRNTLMIISSLLIDIYIIASFANFVLFSKGVKFLASLFVFYIMLIFIRRIFYNAIPDNFQFNFPGFPSIFVPYYKTSSFYYSPTIGILVLCCLEWDRSKNMRKIMLWTGIGLVIFESLFMVTLRKHFVADIFTSIYLPHFIYIISERYADHLIYDVVLKRNKDSPKTQTQNS